MHYRICTEATETRQAEELARHACTAKAVSQDGKPLSGAARTSFMKKCEKGA
jgi:hypothetical protein